MTWEERNRDAIVAELAVLRARLRGEGRSNSEGDRGTTTPEAELAAARTRLGGSSRLDDVARGFGLTEFERALLLLAAGPEIAAGTAADLARAGVQRLTLGVALSVLPGAHWDALTPRAPLRYWRLIHLTDLHSPMHSPVIADERLLHHLLGADYLDPELATVVHRLPTQPGLPPTLTGCAAAVQHAWEHGEIAVVAGPQRGNLMPVAAAAAQLHRCELFAIDAGDLPAAAADRDRLLRLMERESVLSRCAWSIDATRATDAAAVLRAVRDIDAATLIIVDADAGTADDPAGVSGTAEAAPVTVRVPRVPASERRDVLAAALSRRNHAENGVEAAATAFDLALPDLHAAAHAACGGARLWDACRERAGGRFDGLARLIRPQASWKLLVLPDSQLQQLHALVAAVRHQATVLQDWGFAQRSARGLGTAALFAGASGTGKTLAAEVIATALERDLVVVDLSQVVSKYIGETEKNLRRVFEAAEDSGAVLLFDEADTLFGKRTEIRDSHDRYANLEVGYLLQRIESFPGLAILTTNAKSVLDQAFLRRLRFVVNFPYPDPAARERMWRLAFPASTPLSGIDAAALATIDLPGGGIAAAAMTAAYLGAGRGEVTADDLATATRWEMAKLGRSVAGR